MDTNRRKLTFAITTILIIIIAGTLLFVISTPPAQRTLVVPDDYAQVSWALGNATAGDKVYVKSGTYNEKEFVIDKPLSLIGEDSSNTILIGGVEGISGGGATINIRSDNVTVSGFTIRSYNFPTPASYFFGIYATGNNCTLTHNIIENCAVGIWNNGSFTNFPSTTISDNIIRDNLQTGILLGGKSSFITIKDNNITGNSLGINLTDGYRCAITGNRISLNKEGGIGLSGARNDIFRNILTYNNGSSIAFHGSSDICRMFNNTIENTQVGIDLAAGSRFSVGGNDISNCAVYAIGFNQTDSSNVFSNTIRNNAVGIWYSQKEDPARTNYAAFYRNSFIDNDQQVFVGVSVTINSFDSGPKDGNYWSDYTAKYPNAVEVDNTGVWNTPYVIDPNNIDAYPLMAPHETTIRALVE